MSAYEDAATSLINGGQSRQTAREILAAVRAENRAETERDWARRIREVGTAKGWSVWAAAFIDPDVPFVDTGMPSTETIVAELRRLDRAATLREAAGVIEREQAREEAAERGRFGYLDHETVLQGVAVRAKATFLRRLASDLEREKDTNGGRQPSAGESTPVSEPLIVDRFDVAMEPAPEEEPVFTIGAIAADGRPVALRFDPQTRRRVAGWLGAPDARHASETARATAHATDDEGPRQ